MEQDLKEALDLMIESFDLNQISTDGPIRHECLTLWIPSKYKAKYNLLQSRSKKKFGKVLKEVVLRSIDKVKVEA